MIIPNVWENKSHVPNHQPDLYESYMWDNPTGTYTTLLKLLSGIMFKGNNGYLWFAKVIILHATSRNPNSSNSWWFPFNHVKGKVFLAGGNSAGVVGVEAGGGTKFEKVHTILIHLPLCICPFIPQKQLGLHTYIYIHYCTFHHFSFHKTMNSRKYLQNTWFATYFPTLQQS